MSIVRTRPSLLVSLALPRQADLKALRQAAEFRSSLPEPFAVTWITAHPGTLVKASAAKSGDEIALDVTAASGKRADLVDAIRHAQRELATSRTGLSAITATDPNIWEHADLIARQGCQAIVTREAQSSSARKAFTGLRIFRGSTSGEQPTRGRFGLWNVPASRQIASRRQVAVTASQLTQDLRGGFALVTIESSVLAEAHGELLEMLNRLSSEKRCAISTVSGYVASQVVAQRSQPAISILRKVA